MPCGDRFCYAKSADDQWSPLRNNEFPYSPNPSENLVPGAAERHIGRSLHFVKSVDTHEKTPQTAGSLWSFLHLQYILVRYDTPSVSQRPVERAQWPSSYRRSEGCISCRSYRPAGRGSRSAGPPRRRERGARAPRREPRPPSSCRSRPCGSGP